MINILLDTLPDEWNGYKIDTDFKTGIKISQCLADSMLSDTERFYTAAGLLFPQTIPPEAEVAEALNWYLNDFNHDNNAEANPASPVMDFDIDQWRIYAAFLNQYRIDLNTVELHWFAFMGLMSNLSDCPFTNVMDIRHKKITPKMTKEEKTAIENAKKIFSIKKSDEKPDVSYFEQQRINEFMKYANT